MKVFRHIYNIGTRILALLLLFCWQACSTTDSDDPQQPSDGRVAVELALSVSTNNGNPVNAPRRMAADKVQAGQDLDSFRGITDIKLIPFDVQRTIEDTDEPISYTVDFFERQGTSANYLTSGSVDLKIGTASFLGYARAPYTENSENSENGWFTYGKLVPSASFQKKTYTKPSDITFQLQQICTKEDADQKATDLAKYLTGIAHAEGWQTATTPALKNLFEEFTADGIRAGSSANVQAMLSQLGKKLAETNWTGDDVTVVNNIREAIKGSGNATATITDDGTGTVTLTGSDLTGYPANIYLPDGSASIRWTKAMKDKEGGGEGEQEEVFADSKFEPLTKGGNGEDMNDQTRYAFPAELYYYVNSRIKTSASSQASNYTLTKWVGTEETDGVLDHYEYDNGEVSVATRSVALKEQMNYGVACLELAIFANAVREGDRYYLVDNASQKVYLDKSGGENAFPLTGLFVGGQFPVNYKFETDDEATEEDMEDERVIYDRDIASGISLTKDVSSYNYTLVLQSKLHKPVNIVLEFRNDSGKEFKGSEGGIISPGTHFYLAGKAIPSITTTDPVKNQRVFTRDHRTTLTVRVISLKNAYNVIPDLKTAQHELEVTDVAVREWNDRSGTGKNLYNW
ncbi:MAG: hypothetical protein IJ614_02000 [Prevotella sp.]|nr:hypothetical protein [Prevotella sp.]